MKRYLMICITLMLCACQEQRRVSNLEKDGVICDLYQNVNFYYPSDWKLKTDDLKISVDILNPHDKEGFYFDTFEAATADSIQEQLNFYLSKLAKVNIKVAKAEISTLQNGIACCYVDGSSEDDETYFSEVMVFMEGQQFIYSYVANQTCYEQNIDTVRSYLESLIVCETQK